MILLKLCHGSYRILVLYEVGN